MTSDKAEGCRSDGNDGGGALEFSISILGFGSQMGRPRADPLLPTRARKEKIETAGGWRRRSLSFRGGDRTAPMSHAARHQPSAVG